MAFKVSYKATITPLNDVTLKITPESGSVYISIVNMLTGAKRPDDQSGFQVLGSNVVFNQSIKPGEYVRVNYEKKPALGSPNFVLSGKAYDGKYYVKFGPVGSERNLLKDFDYVVGEQGDVALINLDPLRVLIDYGNRLIVEYQYSSERSEDTKTK